MHGPPGSPWTAARGETGAIFFVCRRRGERARRKLRFGRCKAVRCGRGARGGAEHRPETLPPGVTFIQTDNASRRFLALAAAKFFPRQPQTIAGSDFGTSGKISSVTAFTRQIWADIKNARRKAVGTYGGVVTPER